ncbi:unnamed protein product, partial [marine sediment metagenome]
AIKEYFPHGSMREGTTVRTTGTLTEDNYKSIKERFLDEGKLLARFEHRGIVGIKTLFEENNTAYMVMEYLRGQTLQKMIENRGVLSEYEVKEYALEIADALNQVHQRNFLHRDIKPENIIVTEDGRVVLIDFGSARQFAAGQTKKMTSWVTHGYAPIEQYSQKGRFTVPTDIYALGATMYHLMTGEQPEAATERVNEPEDILTPLIRLNPEISITTNDAILWAMALRAHDRPQSVTEFIQALEGTVSPPVKAPAEPPEINVFTPPPPLE